MNHQSLKRISLLVMTLLASIAVSAAAAPQDDIFSRPSDKKEVTEAGSGDSEVAETEPAAGDQTASETPAEESTARIEQQSDGWYTVIDDASGVEVRLPGEPTYKELSWSPIAGRPPLTNHFYNSLSKDKQISVDYSWYDMHEAPATAKALKATLDGAVKGSVVNVFGELAKMESVKSGKVNGREFEFKFTLNLPGGKSAAMSGHSRVFIKGKRRYQLNVIAYAGKEDKALATKLFDSLLIKGD